MRFQEGQLAQVYDLAAARERRAARQAAEVAPTREDEIPADVWAEVEAANRLFEDLQSDGRRIVFDDGHLDGRLVIALCDLEGRVLRAVAPGEVVAGGSRDAARGGDAA